PFLCKGGSHVHVAHRGCREAAGSEEAIALAAQLDLAPFSSFVREDPELFAEMAEELDEETRARFASQIQAQKDWHCWRTCGRPMPRNSPPTSMRQNRSSPSGPFSRMRGRLLSM